MSGRAECACPPGPCYCGAQEANELSDLRRNLSKAREMLREALPMTHEEDLDGHHIPRCVGCRIDAFLAHDGGIV